MCAVRKSPSGLSIHSSVVGFIRDPPTLEDLAHERVPHTQTLTHLGRCPHNQINADVWGDATDYTGSLLQRASLESHHDKQVKVGKSAGRSIRMRPKHHDPVGVNVPGDPVA